MSKPVMQDIANYLSISRVSVWKALTNRPGVSKKLRQKILDRAIEIGYTNESRIDDAKTSAVASRTIATVVSRQESSLFWMQIIHQIAVELSNQGINLLYVNMPSDYEKEYILPAVLSDGSVSGIIVLNIYSEPLIKMLADLSLPKVFLDSVPAISNDTLNGDLVLIEGRNAVKQITCWLLDSGRTRLGFVGDINYAQTNMDRYLGYLDAFAERGLVCDENLSLTSRLHLTTHYEQISAFLDSLDAMPEGFVCASDYIAHFIRQYFTEHGIEKSAVCLTGFDNNTEYANVANKITTVDVQTKSMGERLASKILFSINHPDSLSEICYVVPNVIYR